MHNLEKNNELEFSMIAWNKINNVYQAIIQHPFNQELILGTLNPKKFNYYIEQDYLLQISAILKSISYEWVRNVYI
jgi:thiaminase